MLEPKNSSVIQALSAIASAVFAFTLIWTTVCQIRIYHKARLDSVQRDRASVFVDALDFMAGTTLGKDLKRASFWVVRPVWKNTGHTHTVAMKNYISVVWLDGPIIPPEFDFPNMSDSGEVQRFERLFVGPRQALFGSGVRLDVSRLVNSRQDKGFYYIYGWTEYKDVFSGWKWHRTEFCYRVIAAGQPSSTDCRFLSEVSGDFNGAEEDCYRKAAQEAPVCRPDNPFKPIVASRAS